MIHYNIMQYNMNMFYYILPGVVLREVDAPAPLQVHL